MRGNCFGAHCNSWMHNYLCWYVTTAYTKAYIVNDLYKYINVLCPSCRKCQASSEGVCFVKLLQKGWAFTRLSMQLFNVMLLY